MFLEGFDRHLMRLIDLWLRLREANLKPQSKKRLFVQQSAQFVGHVVSLRALILIHGKVWQSRT